MAKARQPGAARLADWRQHTLRRMARSRTVTLRFLNPLPGQVLLQPRTQGQWSLKDTLAHFVAWEEEAVRRLALIEQGRGQHILFYDDMRQTDRFNARAVRRARRISWPALLRRAAAVRERLVRAFRRLPLPALDDPTHRYTVKQWLPEFAYTHEQEHLKRFRAWWRKRRLPGA